MSRWTLVWVLLLSIAIPVSAGPDDPLTCTDGTYYLSQFVIVPPPISDTLSQLTVTVVGSDIYEPVTLIETPDEIINCNSNAPQANYYEASLGDHTFIPTQYTSQDTMYFAGQNRINVGEFDNRFGESLLVLEAFAAPGEDVVHAYSIELTERMRENGLPIDVYLFTLDGYTPAMTAYAPFQNEPTIAEYTEDISIVTSMGNYSSALKLSIPSPEFEGAINLNVNTGGVDFYVLAMPIMTGEVVIGEGIAQLHVDEVSGQLRVDCAGAEAFDNGVMITLPQEGDFTVTAIALDPADAVLALVDPETGAGACFDNDMDAQLYGVAMPSIVASSTGTTATATISGGSGELIVGSRGRGRTEIAVIIEGGLIESGTTQTYKVTTSTGMVAASDFLRAYVVTTENTFDPILAWVDELGLTLADDANSPYICDNAGFDGCYSPSTPLIGSFIRQSDGRLLNGGELDASLQLPIWPELVGVPLNLQVSGSNDTAGNYQVVLHLIVEE